MSDHNARQAGLTVAERTTIQAAKRLADSMGNTWLSSDLETILAAYSADARNGEGVEQSQAWRELRAALNVLAIGKMSDASRRKLAAETLKDFDNLAAPAAPAPNCDCGAASNNGVHSFDCPDAAQASAASKCTRCEYIGKCDCEPAPAAPTVATTIVIQSEGKTVWAGVRHHTWDETVYVELPAPAPAAQAVRAYAMYRTRPDENDGKEFFFCAMWHPDTIPQEGERLVKGWFVPETQQSATPAEPAPSDRQGDVECCKTCGGTGDVRDMNGEWHGYCWCGARSKLNGGKSSRTHDVPYMPANTQEAKAYVLGLEDSATPECTCPSGNGSLRHPCPAHPADAASEAIYLAKLRNGTTTWLEFTAEAWAKLDSTWIRCKADAASEAGEKREILPGYAFVERNGGVWMVLAPNDTHWTAFRSTPTGDLISAIVEERERQQGAQSNG